MSESLIIGLVTVVLSAVSSMALVGWRLNQIEKKLEVHNGYAQLFAESKTDIALIKQKLEFIADKVDCRDELVRDKLSK